MNNRGRVTAVSPKAHVFNTLHTGGCQRLIHPIEHLGVAPFPDVPSDNGADSGLRIAAAAVAPKVLDLIHLAPATRKENAPHLACFEASNQEVIHIFDLIAERTERRRPQLVAKSSFVGGDAAVTDQPIENPAFKRSCISPNLHCQIISRNMPKKIGVKILVCKRFLGVAVDPGVRLRRRESNVLEVLHKQGEVVGGPRGEAKNQGEREAGAKDHGNLSVRPGGVREESGIPFPKGEVSNPAIKPEGGEAAIP